MMPLVCFHTLLNDLPGRNANTQSVIKCHPRNDDSSFGLSVTCRIIWQKISSRSSGLSMPYAIVLCMVRSCCSGFMSPLRYLQRSLKILHAKLTLSGSCMWTIDVGMVPLGVNFSISDFGTRS